MAALALSLFLVAMYTLAFFASSAYVHSHVVWSITPSNRVA